MLQHRKMPACPTDFAGAVIIVGLPSAEAAIGEPGVRQARAKHVTASRGWLQGLRWGHRQRYAVHSLDARLLLRVFVETDGLATRTIVTVETLGDTVSDSVAEEAVDEAETEEAVDEAETDEAMAEGETVSIGGASS